MHATELIPLATRSTQLALIVAELRLEPRRSTAQDIWLTSRYRQENWLSRLARHRDAIVQPNTSRRIQLWREIMPVVHEVLLAEPLTRVLAYAASVWSKRGLDSDLAPLANSTLAAHIEARHRCLHLIVFGQGLAVDQASQVNRLRRNLEDFTDQLLARLPSLGNPGQYAFDPRAVCRRQLEVRSLGRHSEWLELMLQMRSQQLDQAWRRELNGSAPNARLNLQLSRHTLGLFPKGCFDTLGLPHSTAALGRLRPAGDAQVRQDCEHPLFQRTKPSPAETPRIQLYAPHRRHRSD